MSTYINVTVGKAGLSDQAKRQTNANRQAKLEADARNKAEVDGTRQRNANRALQGIGPDGKPLYGQALASKRPWEEPAAFRNGVRIDVAEGFLQNKGNRQYTIWSTDKTVSLDCNFELATYPEPQKRYGNPTYNHLSFFWKLRWPGQPWEYTLMEYGELGPNQYSSTLYYTVFPDSSTPPDPNSSEYIERMYYDVWDPTSTSNWTSNIEESSAWDLYEFYKNATTYENVVARLAPEFNPLDIDDYTLEEIAGEQFANQTISTTYSYTGEVKLCLPVSGTSFILYLASYDYKVRRYSGVKYNCTHSIVDFGNIETPPIHNAVWVYSTEARIRVNSAITVVDEFDQVYENSKVKENCFLVSTSGVREVAVPSALAVKIKNIYKGMDSRPASLTSKTVKTDEPYGTATPVIVNPNQPWLGVPPYQYLDYNYNETYHYLPYTNGSDYAVDVATAKYTPTTNWGLLRQYGLGALRSGYHLGGLTAFTPAVFTALENGETIRTTQGDPFNDYSDVYSPYLGQAPFRGIYVDGAAVGNDPLKAAYDYTKTAPATIYDDMTNQKFFKNAAKPFTTTPPFYEILQVWNWGATSYCRQMCLALGFTEADLTP